MAKFSHATTSSSLHLSVTPPSRRALFLCLSSSTMPTALDSAIPSRASTCLSTPNGESVSSLVPVPSRPRGRTKQKKGRGEDREAREHADGSADATGEGQGRGEREREGERERAVAPGRSRKHGDVSRCPARERANADGTRRRGSAGRADRGGEVDGLLDGTSRRESESRPRDAIPSRGRARFPSCLRERSSERAITSRRR